MSALNAVQPEGNSPGRQISKLDVDETLLDATIHSTIEGLSMTGVVPSPVGVTRFFQAPRPYSVILGMVGHNSGTATLNFGERGMLYLASKFLGEEFTEVNDDVLDAAMELGNMVAGCMKGVLRGTRFEVANISLPSLVIGAKYDFYYSRGIRTVSVEFELEDLPALWTKDRYLSTTISLLRGAGAATS